MTLSKLAFNLGMLIIMLAVVAFGLLFVALSVVTCPLEQVLFLPTVLCPSELATAIILQQPCLWNENSTSVCSYWYPYPTPHRPWRER